MDAANNTEIMFNMCVYTVRAFFFALIQEIGFQSNLSSNRTSIMNSSMIVLILVSVLVFRLVVILALILILVF